MKKVIPTSSRSTSAIAKKEEDKMIKKEQEEEAEQEEDMEDIEEEEEDIEEEEEEENTAEMGVEVEYASEEELKMLEALEIEAAEKAKRAEEALAEAKAAMVAEANNNNNAQMGPSVKKMEEEIRKKNLLAEEAIAKAKESMKKAEEDAIAEEKSRAIAIMSIEPQTPKRLDVDLKKKEAIETAQASIEAITPVQLKLPEASTEQQEQEAEDVDDELYMPDLKRELDDDEIVLDAKEEKSTVSSSSSPKTKSLPWYMIIMTIIPFALVFAPVSLFESIDPSSFRNISGVFDPIDAIDTTPQASIEAITPFRLQMPETPPPEQQEQEAENIDAVKIPIPETSPEQQEKEAENIDNVPDLKRESDDGEILLDAKEEESTVTSISTSSSPTTKKKAIAKWISCRFTSPLGTSCRE